MGWGEAGVGGRGKGGGCQNISQLLKVQSTPEKKFKKCTHTHTKWTLLLTNVTNCYVSCCNLCKDNYRISEVPEA